ncbi:all-trans retinoic acid-induced differentiation factor-like [Uloborus diversus]|uniref:all-trans retinoic acid-induced differentiation factor-like n=1 Tax=Uloborus diversus TaxID=327109 RepID=UPI00240A0801|nr:all-trans retinoic acid-induced differentiation factor-like [Uloborus diversus]
MTHCFHEEDPCVYLNVSCTDFANCSHTGPGTARCVCHPGRHGYKCLNQGEFPSTAFAFSVVIPAVVLSVVVWFVQGRDVYKTNTL